MFDSLVDLLDQPAATSGNINVVYLRNADAVKLAQTLRAVVSGRDGGNLVSSPSTTSTSTRRPVPVLTPHLLPIAHRPVAA